MNIGIDAISFYTSPYYLDLTELAKARGIDPNKFLIGLRQSQMGIVPPDEDIVTLGANAAERLLQNSEKSRLAFAREGMSAEDRQAQGRACRSQDAVSSEDDIPSEQNSQSLLFLNNSIDTLLFATESGIDQSKAAGIYVHRLLGLSPKCSIVELKQACYSATAALQMAIGLIHRKPDRKVLIIASDISRYGFNTPGESSQGCGAIAMLITQNPRLLTISSERGLHTEDVMDFWRPNYRDTPLVEGNFSADMYLRGLEQAWQHYQAESRLDFNDHAFHCYHTPVPRLVEKAHYRLAKINNIQLADEQIQQQLAATLDYNRRIGNAYCASLYISFLSLIENLASAMPGARIGFYSYGSGYVAEYFNGTLQPDYATHLDKSYHRALLDARKPISYEQYKEWYSFSLPKDGSSLTTNPHTTGTFRLCGIKDHKREYTRAE